MRWVLSSPGLRRWLSQRERIAPRSHCSPRSWSRRGCQTAPLVVRAMKPPAVVGASWIAPPDGVSTPPPSHERVRAVRRVREASIAHRHGAHGKRLQTSVFMAGVVCDVCATAAEHQLASPTTRSHGEPRQAWLVISALKVGSLRMGRSPSRSPRRTRRWSGRRCQASSSISSKSAVAYSSMSSFRALPDTR